MVEPRCFALHVVGSNPAPVNFLVLHNSNDDKNDNISENVLQPLYIGTKNLGTHSVNIRSETGQEMR